VTSGKTNKRNNATTDTNKNGTTTLATVKDTAKGEQQQAKQNDATTTIKVAEAVARIQQQQQAKQNNGTY
jgi:hypothetical protein